MIELSGHTEAFARRLAAELDLSVEDAIRQALEAREAAVRPVDLRGREPAQTDARHDAIDRFVRRVAAAPILDPRAPREIMDDLDPL